MPNFKKIVHVGLPKSGSTSLQHIFQKLHDAGYIDSYNPPELFYSIMGEFYKRKRNPGISFDTEVIFDRNVLISSESLIGFDPGQWEENARVCHDIFGSDALIILVLRDYKSLARSIFLHRVSQGFSANPRNFFIDEEKFEILYKDPSPESYLRYEKLKYNNLIKALTGLFNNVLVLEMKEALSLDFLKDIFSVPSSVIGEVLKHNYHNKRGISLNKYKYFLIKDYFLKKLGLRRVRSIESDLDGVFLGSYGIGNERLGFSGYDVASSTSQLKEMLNLFFRQGVVLPKNLPNDFPKTGFYKKINEKTP